jgi:alkylation response protein AidB-like acyl-CoA dehydrogenase
VTADGRLTGTGSHAIEAVGADLLLVRAGRALYVVPASAATIRPVDTLDQSRSQATVVLASAPGAEVGTDPDRAEQLIQTMLAVECVGAAAHCLETTVAHLTTRVQFGRPIGTFQALKHRCADLAVGVVSASATARAAVRVAVSSPAELPLVAPLAKKYCADVFVRVAAEMIQLHGGIGFTWEHETHRYFKRAKSTQLLHGSPAELRRLVGERAGLR